MPSLEASSDEWSVLVTLRKEPAGRKELRAAPQRQESPPPPRKERMRRKECAQKNSHAHGNDEERRTEKKGWFCLPTFGVVRKLVYGCCGMACLVGMQVRITSIIVAYKVGVPALM